MLHAIEIDWFDYICKSQIYNVNNANLLDGTLEKYSRAFDSELGKIKDVLVKTPVASETKPIFYKARPVPYAIKEKVENELERLVKEGISKPLKYSERAAPIVPVQKSDGSVRICGEYKVTVNKVTQCDQYPNCRTKDLLATLNGGETFLKLDVSHTYQELVLDEGSRKYLTVNTHKGLFQPLIYNMVYILQQGYFKEKWRSV